jgi:quercetin dioxygenase-like cupin family protein
MEWVDPETQDVTAYDSHGIRMSRAAQLSSTDELRVHLATVEPGGLLGRHPTHLWQLFRVLTGAGWVAADDAVRHDISAGQGVVWSPGEVHESGSTAGMTVLIVQSSRPLPG